MNVTKCRCDVCGKETEDCVNMQGWIRIEPHAGSVLVSVYDSRLNNSLPRKRLHRETTQPLDFCCTGCLLSFFELDGKDR